ncbi:nitrite reductase [Endozoicomonas montiporae]|uniref:Nitrite reductase n=2 Tax=Endozoicomonas montiporae TaxID=1027273 RepID=A0A081N7E8_9GAMM|nr:nitrite reductase large subunit NirB [Endozoicomonas montiporae]AMO55787.1 nitrite reductase (NADH) large subunit [Endozoicomonas montiporae CL-33]KEQ14371.1 nitrite reductase [Endozoicomonas montiporae]
MGIKKTLVVVGNGMVGHRFLEQLVEAGGLNQFDVLVFGEEPRPAYDRVHLSEYFSGRSAEELSVVPEGFYQQPGLTLVLNDRVEVIDRTAGKVITSGGLEQSYDHLVLATGSYPFVPPVTGNDRPNCFVYRTIEDLEAIQSAAASCKTGVVVGGGLLGLEAAKALKDLGLDTHVVEFAPRLMAVQVDEGGGAMLQHKIETLGVTVHTGKNTQQITAGEQSVHQMQFADGESLETDMILFSAGIRPRDELARQCDLALGERGGIVIDNECRTSDQTIFAIGECALWENRIFGLVAPGYQMGQVVVDQLLNTGESLFKGADMSTKLKLMGVDVASIGDAHARTQGALSYQFIDEEKEVYKKLVVSGNKKKVLGAVLVGDAEEYGTLLQMVLNDIRPPANPAELILPPVDGQSSAGVGVAALPDTAQICSCFNVSKGDLVGAVAAGCQGLSALKAETSAGTGCGGCAQLVKQVLDHELLQLGIEVKKDLCEHFPYSRQELYHLVRVGQLKTFAEVIEKHGSGLGCDICKPTVGSILASCWNDYILHDEHAPLQDTNDYFLGNMQKDGTYSVVPRIPGGEITPEKLLVIGEVGRDFNLYTKITGGQRIDLFGAQVHQLPAIWKRLVDAGFETGHAYGKSLRTVKSCVGSTWCRYGVQDSVGMAIHVENRYRGVRSPHKMKMAVSGCTRECAEAQSKDVGVIATEQGWNLYVGGNGGMKPRHADLFATGLDDHTLIQYIDRFLMFYIRTAERLQRTSVWLDNLEGGLDYLREVIIDDSLGIAQELENEMAHLIETYQCEWKTTLDNPEKLKRFSHFVNSDQSDSNVIFVREREQIRPATEVEKIQLKQVG